MTSRLPDSRPSARERGYTTRWDKARKTYLADNPWCVLCLVSKRRVPATHVDHIVPHRGDQRLFWDRANWRGLCGSCHNRKTAKQDMPGRRPVYGCDINGVSLDPNHAWRK